MEKFLAIVVVAALLGACGQEQQTQAAPGTACNQICRTEEMRSLLESELGTFKTEHVDPLGQRVTALEEGGGSAEASGNGGDAAAENPLMTRDRLPQDVDIAEIPGARLRHIPDRNFCAIVPPPGQDYDRAAVRAAYRERCPH